MLDRAKLAGVVYPILKPVNAVSWITDALLVAEKPSAGTVTHSRLRTLL